MTVIAYYVTLQRQQWEMPCTAKAFISIHCGLCASSNTRFSNLLLTARRLQVSNHSVRHSVYVLFIQDKVSIPYAWIITKFMVKLGASAFLWK